MGSLGFAGILLRQTIDQIGSGVEIFVAALQKIVDHIRMGIGFGNYDTAHLIVGDGGNVSNCQLVGFSGNKEKGLR